MPKLHESRIHDLRPTQLTVGLIEVQDKKTHLAAMAPADQQAFMQAHPIPAVVGPGGQLYITDHHHLGRAALEAGVTIGYFMVEADLSKNSLDDFWKAMDQNLWVHPLDEHGVRHYYASIPDHLEKTGRRPLPVTGRLCAQRRRLRQDADRVRGIRVGRFLPPLDPHRRLAGRFPGGRPRRAAAGKEQIRPRPAGVQRQITTKRQHTTDATEGASRNMAEEFEVRGVHEHVLDHAAEHGGPDSFAGRIAVMTAILSTAGAIFGYQGGATQNEALLLKNEAAIHKTEAANQWAYYQAKSQKQAITELAAQLPGVDHDAAKREAQRYATEKEQIRQTAETHERAAGEADKASEVAVHHHHRWAQALVAIQVSIALAAITMLTRRRWLLGFSYGIGALGGALAVMALLHL